MKPSKEQQIEEWLEANPGKEREDWLLEVRCKDEKQREEFKEFLKEIEKSGNRLIIPNTLPLDIHTRPADDCSPILSTCSNWEDYGDVNPEFDFSIRGHYYDLDAEAQKFYENITPGRPYDAAMEYLTWKAEESGLLNTDFIDQAYQDDFFKYNFCSWKEVLNHI